MQNRRHHSSPSDWGGVLAISAIVPLAARWRMGVIVCLLCCGSLHTIEGAENKLRTSVQPNGLNASQVTWRPKTVTKTNPAQSMVERPSLVAQAARGNVIDEMPPARLINGSVQPTQFFEQSCACEGPVCDCGAEPSCGFESVVGIEPGCGFEAGCGAEPVCGMELCEPSCGYEIACNTCGDYCDGACDSVCQVQTYPLFLPLLRIDWRRFDFFAGVQSFTGPMNYANTDGTNRNNRIGSGSFGFYQGFNEGRSLKWLFGWDMAGQIGARFTQSNLTGAEFTGETRHQAFLTAGIFRRVDYGLQYGVVFDYMNDDWYFQSDLTQLRGELSWKDQGCHVWGFQFMAGLSDETSRTFVRNAAGATVQSTVSLEPTDQYRLFYRRLLNNAGSCDAFAGWTDRDDALIGASLNMPLRRNVVLQTGATYLIPNEGSDNGGNEEESWNIALGLVYRPGGPNGCGRYCRPLFDVADNGTFMVDRK